VWPRWLSLTIGGKKDNEWFSAQVQTGYPPFFDLFMKWLARCPYFYVLDSYSSDDHYPFDPDRPKYIILTITFYMFAFSLSPVVLIMQHT
jgi:hypothetical protein